MNTRFLGLVGLLAVLFLASCEVESVAQQEELANVQSSDDKGTGDDPPEN